MGGTIHSLAKGADVTKKNGFYTELIQIRIFIPASIIDSKGKFFVSESCNQRVWGY